MIADRAEADVDVRIVHADDAPELERKIRGLEPELDGTEIEVYGGYTRPPLEPSEQTDRLLAKAQEHGRGSSASSSTRAARAAAPTATSSARSGSPSSTASARTAPAPTPRHEHVLLPSLPQRIALLARLLADPGV